jgi:hypothetical protein
VNHPSRVTEDCCQFAEALRCGLRFLRRTAESLLNDLPERLPILHEAHQLVLNAEAHLPLEVGIGVRPVDPVEAAGNFLEDPADALLEG